MYEIVISGIVSVQSSMFYKKGLMRSYIPATTLDFFCVYSDYEIAIGSCFKCFLNRETGSSVEVNAKLADVTQQWGVPYDSIPYGHRTICKIEFDNENSVVKVKKGVPIVNSWREGNYNFALIG